MNPVNHRFLCFWPVHGQIQYSHPARKRKCDGITNRPDERVRSVGDMSRRRENDEETLNAKVGREHFLLQGGKGGHGKGIVGDLGHDEALRRRALLLSYHPLHVFSIRSTKTHLVEFGADKRSIDQQVIWSCTCELSQTTDETVLETHVAPRSIDGDGESKRKENE